QSRNLYPDILGIAPSTRPQHSDNRNERLLWFSLPVFEHLDQLRHAGELKLGPRGRTVLHGHLQKVLSGLIAEDVRKSFRGRRKAGGQIPPLAGSTDAECRRRIRGIRTRK